MLEKIYKLQIKNNLLLVAMAAKLEKLEFWSSQEKITTDNFMTLREKIPLNSLEQLKDFEEQLLQTSFSAIFL
ncbi:hypothetical protein RN001_005702 [Aquatica leii]|uniref:Uncharacterized protein n=1 Tax=Aquatica leii TaxID=1421715 RepID=A0AAN7PD25_9COLE|nr:hypothetical protein RN001_005702 [Aquatica leii]